MSRFSESAERDWGRASAPTTATAATASSREADATAPREDGERAEPGRERHEAGLRVREPEPGRDRGRRERSEQEPARRGREREDADDHDEAERAEAAVDARVEEDRVDAEEVGVGVDPQELLVGEELPRVPLVEGDAGERDAERDLDRREPRGHPAAEVDAAEQRGERPERQVERERVGGAALEARRPEEARAGEHDVGAERPADRPEARRQAAAAQDPDRLGEDARGDHAVERQEQVLLVVAAADRDAQPADGDRCERQEPGTVERQEGEQEHGAAEPDGPGEGEHGTVGDRVLDLRLEVERDRDGAGDEERDSDEPRQRGGRDEQEQHAEGRGEGCRGHELPGDHGVAVVSSPWWSSCSWPSSSRVARAPWPDGRRAHGAPPRRCASRAGRRAGTHRPAPP